MLKEPGGPQELGYLEGTTVAIGPFCQSEGKWLLWLGENPGNTGFYLNTKNPPLVQDELIGLPFGVWGTGVSFKPNNNNNTHTYSQPTESSWHYRNVHVLRADSLGLESLLVGTSLEGTASPSAASEPVAL